MSETLIAPHLREKTVGRTSLEAQLRHSLAQGALSNGWLITGPSGAGKATLAYRLARAILEPAALSDAGTLDMPASARTFRLVAQRAHPDLFVAEREYDEKTQRHQSEIPVDKVRALSAFLSKTASGGGWRVAIIDTADDLNRQASNALLKSLEEPPAKTAVLLLSSAPGRLLPTIRSRCRRIDLRPVSDEDVTELLVSDAAVDRASTQALATAAKGRPGLALILAAGEGVEAIEALNAFLDAAVTKGEAGPALAIAASRTSAAKWELFCAMLLDRLSEAARAGACGAPVPQFAEAPAAAIVEAHDAVNRLLRRGEAVNLDKAQMLGAVARLLHAARRAA